MPPVLADVVTDVALREGSQQPADLRGATVAQKAQLFEALQAAGLRSIEVTAFAPGAWFADADALAAEVTARARPATALHALYFNTEGLARLLAHPRFVASGQFCTAATATYRLNNYRQRSAEHARERLRRFAEAFHAHGLALDLLTLSTAWGEPDEATPAEAVVALLDGLLAEAAALGLPVHGLSLADTVGQATPEAVAALIAAVKAAWPGVAVTAHLHPPAGEAAACVEAALAAGVDRWDAALGGVGGSPLADAPGGNLDLRWLVRAWEARGWPTGFDAARLDDALALLATRITRPLPLLPPA